MKKLVSIEELLTWAFLELANASHDREGGLNQYGSTWAGMAAMESLGCIIYGSGRSPDFVPFSAHPDAIIVEAAVRGLDDIALPPGWHPFPGWDDPHGTVAAEVAASLEALALRGEAVRRNQIVNLVTSCSILGRQPVSFATRPDDVVVTRYGNPAWFVARKARDHFNQVYEYETNGYDARKRRPMKGAYNKYTLKSPIGAMISSEMDRYFWFEALDALKTALNGRLADHMIRSNPSPVADQVGYRSDDHVF